MSKDDPSSPEHQTNPSDSGAAPGRLFDSEKLDPVYAILEAPPSHVEPEPVPMRRRRVKLPVILFCATCLSTFWLGANRWLPTYYLEHARLEQSLMPLRRILWHEWQNGLIYMAGLIAILLSHEMGHFLMTLRYRIPASLPFFLPFPLNPLGTVGAVIGMDGSRADRKQIFDIGIAGPLAGLVFAIPLSVIGVMKIDFTVPGAGPYSLDLPLGLRLLLEWLQPAGYVAGQFVYPTQLNPYFMAGWAGCLVTGLNMVPVSQLDGGHIIYALLGKHAKWIGRTFLVAAIAYEVYALLPVWFLMIVIVLLLGTDHPPTRDDSVELGWPRIILGWCSLVIPILCLPLQALK